MAKEVGAKVDVGGFDLYYTCMGENDGNPTVILESGYGLSSTSWEKVQAEVSQMTKVVAYDRAGLSRSDRGNKPLDSHHSVWNLHALLSEAMLEPPYILVGHSFGGLNARLYASSFPSEVVGLVLVDPSHEEQHEKWMPLLTDKMQTVFQGVFTKEGTYDDFLTSMKQVRSLRKHFGDMPITVLSAGQKGLNTDESYRMWIALHEDLLELSSNSTHIIVENSGHNIQTEAPEAVVDAIEKMIHVVK